MTINKRNRIRRELAETASRLTRCTAPFPGGEAYCARLTRARTYYARWSVPDLRSEIEQGRRAVHAGIHLPLASSVAP